MLSEQQQAFMKVLDLVDDSGCLPHVMLVGSWAEFVYQKAEILKDFDPSIKTMDVDFLVRNLRKPVPAAQLATLAKERGYYVVADRMDGTTKIVDTTGLEVEFLIGKKGAGVEPSLKTNIGVTAQALRHLDILLRHPISVFCLGYTVNVPSPEAYAVHKMVINSERGAKSGKDARAVVNLMPYLRRDALRAVFAELTTREKTRVVTFLERKNYI